QQHQWRLAHEYLSQPYHLALTTRHFRQSPKRQLPDTQGVENLFDRQLGLFPGPVAASRAAAAEHSFVGHQGNGLGQWLRQVADTTNALVGSNRRQILPGKGHGAGNRQQTGDGFQQRGLTHSIRANHGHQRARRYLRQGKSGEDGSVPVAGGHGLQLQGHNAALLLRPMIRVMNSGIPTSAVTIPTGNTTPGTSSLLAMDDNDSRTAPARALPGNRKR